METILLSILGAVVTTLLTLLAWIGNRVHTRLDAINTTLIKIDQDLSQKIGTLDVRVSVLEHRVKTDRQDCQ